MKSAIVAAVTLLLATACPLAAQDDGEPAASRSERNLEDPASLEKYLQNQLQEIERLRREDASAALEKIEQVSGVLEEAEPESAEGRRKLAEARRYIEFARQRVALMKMPLAEFVDKLEASPNDARLISDYVTKVMLSAADLIGKDLEAAQKVLTEAKANLQRIERQAAGGKQEVATAVAGALQRMSSMERFVQDQLRRKKRLAGLIGKDAAPLKADAWINGDSVTAGDVAGKVVLLDFWAVWCAPCIETLPHLKAWYDKYHEQGLVMIGVTNYTGSFAWDPVKQKVVESPEDVSRDAEREMLAQFATKHELPYVIAVQSDNTLADYYAVTSIPQVVLIDRQGKVRLVKVGAGEEAREEISVMLERLIEAPAP